MKPKQLLLTCLLALVGSIAEQKALAYDALIDGIFYYLSGSEATVTSGDYKYKGPVKIPSSITYHGETYSSIGYDAFENCTSLTSITIPNSVTSIGGGAFYGCN